MNETMIVTASAGGSAEDAAAGLVRQLKAGLHGENPKLLVVFASTTQPLTRCAPALRAAFAGAPLLGASTAGEFTGDGDTTGSAVAFALAGDVRVATGLGTGLRADVERAVGSAIASLPTHVAGFEHATALMLLDPFSGMGEEATLTAAMMLGEAVPLAGGAAADDMKMERSEIACDAVVTSDAVAVAKLYTRAPLGIGVCHGHTPLSAPMRVTRASGATVYEIDGRPAWEVWKDATRVAAKARGMDPDTLQPGRRFADYLNLFEAGLDCGNDEHKIRVPLSCDAAGALTFACGMPENTSLRVMESVPEAQIESARRAVRRARAGLTGDRVAGALVFDCSCRKSILGDDFQRAVRAMSSELDGAPLAGFETYGEIALCAGAMSGFHNTTTVVLAFPT